MSTLSAGKIIQTGTLDVAGLGVAAIKTTNLNLNNLNIPGNLTVDNHQVATQDFVNNAVSSIKGTVGPALDTLGEIQAALGDDANLAATLRNTIDSKANSVSPTLTGVTTLDSSGDILNIKVKDTPLTINTSMMSDLLATTQSGRTKLAKALNYGANKPLYDLMHYTEVLDAGYSGKGVSYGHFEKPVDFRDPMFRHVLNPRDIYPTGTGNAQYWQMANNSQNKRTSGGWHSQCTASLMCGFDLHSKLTLTNSSPYTVIDTDAFVMSAAYNVDMTNLTWIDSGYAADYNFNPELQDDDFVELVEKMWAQDIKVASCSIGVYSMFGDYYTTANNSTVHDGVSNVISYMISLCADHDLLWVNSGGNTMASNATTYPDVKVAAPGSGYMSYTADCRNMLSAGSTRFNYLVNGVQYDYAVLDYYKKVDESGNVFYRTSAATGYDQREVLPYHGYGVTTDGRIKPDILSAYDSRYDYMPFATSLSTDAYGPDKYLYRPWQDTSTSVSSPRIASGVALLREALPKLDAHQIRECIMLSASHGTAPTTTGAGYGLINLEAALAYGQARPQTMPPSLTVPDSLGQTWVPKSVQSQMAVFDPNGDSAYQIAYATTYAAAYADYVASAPSLWSGDVLDVSPAKGQFMSSGRAMNVDGSFDVQNAKSWICCAEADMEELKNLMTTNGIKVGYTSKALGAFCVTADSVDQLKAVVQGNTLIRDIQPSQLLKISSGWETSEESEEIEA